MNDASANRSRNLGFFFDETVRRLAGQDRGHRSVRRTERTSTYRQLDERMDRVAAMLARLGVRPGERVAMLVGNRVEFIEFFFGAMRAGTIPLLLNTRLAADTLEGLIADANCVLAIVDPSCNKDALSIAGARAGSPPHAARPGQGRASSPTRRRWRSPRPPSRRRRLPTTRRRSSPTRPVRPGGPRARS